MRLSTFFPSQKKMDTMITVPIHSYIKTLLISYARTMGYKEHTAIVRSWVIKGLEKAITEMSESDRRLLATLVGTSELGDALEKAIISELGIVPKSES
jgi:hypothetical protein